MSVEEFCKFFKAKNNFVHVFFLLSLTETHCDDDIKSLLCVCRVCTTIATCNSHNFDVLSSLQRVCSCELIESIALTFSIEKSKSTSTSQLCTQLRHIRSTKSRTSQSIGNSTHFSLQNLLSRGRDLRNFHTNAIAREIGPWFSGNSRSHRLARAWATLPLMLLHYLIRPTECNSKLSSVDFHFSMSSPPSLFCSSWEEIFLCKFSILSNWQATSVANVEFCDQFVVNNTRLNRSWSFVDCKTPNIHCWSIFHPAEWISADQSTCRTEKSTMKSSTMASSVAVECVPHSKFTFFAKTVQTQRETQLKHSFDLFLN